MYGPHTHPRIALILRRLRSRFGISAPRMAVRAHVPWYVRVVAAGVVLGIGLALAGWIYDAGRRFAGFDRRESELELNDLRDAVSRLESENARLKASFSASDSTMAIEVTARQKIESQIKHLENDNARLREDLAVFEKLASADGKGPGISIYRLQLEPEGTPGRYRYRMLVSAQGGRTAEAKFHVQFLLSLLRAGKPAMLTLPAAGAGDTGQYVVSVRRFRRLEGVVDVPPDAKVTTFEARLLQDGQPVATEKINL